MVRADSERVFIQVGAKAKDKLPMVSSVFTEEVPPLPSARSYVKIGLRLRSKHSVRAQAELRVVRTVDRDREDPKPFCKALRRSDNGSVRAAALQKEH